MPIKSTTTTERCKKKKNNPTSLNIRIINVFLGSLLSKSCPCWESQSTLPPWDALQHCAISGHAMEAPQMLIWCYFCVFLPPMSTAIKTTAFSFVGALNDPLYIPKTQSLPS